MPERTIATPLIVPPLGGVAIDTPERQWSACRYPVEVAVHRLINGIRRHRGERYLQTSKVLTATAQKWARLMADMGSVAHAYGPTEAMEEIRRSGYPNAWLGQNIAAGQPSPFEVVQAWMESDGHRKSMLSGTFREMGVGYIQLDGSKYTHYWVCDFGSGDTEPTKPCPKERAG